jgi:hypothetical protein
MRPFESDFDDLDEFDEFDELDYGGVQTIRRMIKNRPRDEQRLEEHRRARPAGKHRRKYEDWSEYEDDSDYFDYNAEEFDRFSGLDFDRH